MYTICVKNSAQLIIGLEDLANPGIISELPYTLITKKVNDSYINGMFLIQTITSNNVVSIRNPSFSTENILIELSNDNSPNTTNNLILLKLS